MPKVAKRPACQSSGRDAKYSRTMDMKLAQPKDISLFDSKAYLKVLMKEIDMPTVPVKSFPIPWASAFDGANMAAEVMLTLGKVMDVRPHQVLGHLAQRWKGRIRAEDVNWS